MIYTQEELNGMSIHTLRVILRSHFNGVPGTNTKSELISLILKIQSGEEIPVRSTKGRKPLEIKQNLDKELLFSDNGDVHAYETGVIKGFFEKHPDGYGYVLRDGMTFSKKDVFVRETLVKRAGLKTGDYIEGSYDGCGDRGGYLLKSVEFVNGRFVDEAEEEISLKIKPVDAKIDLSADDDYILSAVDAFCPIGKGQRCLVSSNDDAHATDFVKRVLKALSKKGLSVTAFLVGAKPETVVELKEKFGNCIVSVDLSCGLEKAVRTCNLVVKSVETKVKTGEEHVLLIDRLSSLRRLVKQYFDLAENERFLSCENSADRFLLEMFGIGANYGDKNNLTVIATVGEMNEIAYNNLREISNAVISLKGEGQVRKRSYRLDVENSWSEYDEVLLGNSKIAEIDALRDEMCQSKEREDAVWQGIKNGEIKF